MPRGDATPERIRAAALALFARDGVAGTSLQMIANELGVTKAAVYYHFRTREAIVQDVLAPAFDGFAAMLREVRGRPGPERPRALVHALARQAVENRELYAVVLQDVTAAQLRRGSEEQLETFRALRDELAGSGADDRAHVRASIFLSGLMAPAVDPDAAHLSDEDLEAAIVAAGHGLLGLPG